jgi:hypothetical protein
MSQYRPDRERAVLYLLEMRRTLLETTLSDDEARDEDEFVDIVAYAPTIARGLPVAA